MTKIPAFQFYPSDWRSDNGVQALGYFERGVWFEMLCLMHDSEKRGELVLNGRPMTDDALARLLRLDRQALSKTLATLFDFGVCSRDEDGTIFSRRMRRDEESRLDNAERQRRHYQAKKKPNANLTEIQQKSNEPSSSSSSSSSSTSEEPKDTTYLQVESGPLKPTPKRKRGTRIDSNFTPDEALLIWAQEKAPNIDHLNENGRFVDYYIAASGARAVHDDWRATWRNWMRKAQDFYNEREKKNGQSIQRTTNGFSQPSTKPSNAEIIRARDYSEWAEFDPVAEFG